MPADTPVTIPVEVPAVAMVGDTLPQVPPPLASVSVIVAATHTVDGPLTGEGSALTVKVLVRVQPVDMGKQIIVTVPGLIPVTMPLDDPTVAIVVVLLLQVTPAEEVSVIVEPTHKVDGPPITAG